MYDQRGGGGGDYDGNELCNIFLMRACSLKFNQNDDLKNKLLQSQGTLVEANQRDNFFSCGLSLADPNILDKSRWLGENILGTILTDLRNNLKP